jgi:hypothetical protein
MRERGWDVLDLGVVSLFTDAVGVRVGFLCFWIIRRERKRWTV